MYQYLKHFDLDTVVIATKADKISRGQYQKNISVIRKTLGMRREEKVIPVSALKRSGYEELLDEMELLLLGEE